MDSLIEVTDLKGEILKVNPDVPIVLFATKIDMRDICAQPLTRQDFKDYQRINRLQGTFETSAKEATDFNVDQAFINSIKLVKYSEREENLLRRKQSEEAQSIDLRRS